MLFTNQEGSIVLRVTTGKVVLTEDENEVLDSAGFFFLFLFLFSFFFLLTFSPPLGSNLELIATHAQNRAAKFVKEGRFVVSFFFSPPSLYSPPLSPSLSLLSCRFADAEKEINSANSFLGQQSSSVGKEFMEQMEGLNEVIQKGKRGGSAAVWFSLCVLCCKLFYLSHFFFFHL